MELYTTKAEPAIGLETITANDKFYRNLFNAGKYSIYNIHTDISEAKQNSQMLLAQWSEECFVGCGGGI